MNWDTFKNRLSKDAAKHKVNVDAAEIWNAIAPTVKENSKKKRKKRLLFFFLCSLGILLLGGGIYFMNTIVEQLPEIATHNNGFIIETNESSTLQNENTPTAFAENEIQSKSVIPTSKNEQNVPKTAASNNLISESENDLKVEHIISKSNREKNTLYESIEKNKDVLNDLSVDTKEEIPSLLNNEIAKTDDISLVLPSLTLLKTPIHPLSIENRLDVDFPPLTFIEKEEEEEEEARKSSLQFLIGMQGGLSLISRKLKAKDPAAVSLLNIRETTEKSLETSHFGFQLSILHQKGFGLSTGIQYTSIAEQYRFNNTDIQIEMEEGITKLRIYPNEDTVAIMGLVPNTVTTEYNQELYNSYKLIDIPVLIGYSYQFEKYRVGVEAGIFANISLKTSGFIRQDETFALVDIDQQQDQFFKSKIGISYYASAYISRPLFSNIELSLSPSFRYFPKDFTTTQNPISQKYFLIGANLGLHYRFGN